MKQAFFRKIPLLLGVGIVLSIVPLITEFTAKSQLEKILQRGELRVASRFSPSTYFIEESRQGGFEFDLTTAYANYLGVELKIEAMSSIAEITKALRLNNVHLAAAGLAATEQRRQTFDFGPSYLDSKILLIYRSGSNNRNNDGTVEPPPKSLQQINDPITVVANSNHAEYLRQLDNPPPWQEAEPGIETLDLLTAVHDNQMRYTLADAEAFEASRTFFPRLRQAFELPEPQPVAWMLKRSPDTSLQQSVSAFFQLDSTQDLIQDLKEHHFEHDARLNLVDSLTFRQHLKSRLPPLRDWFQQAAKQYGIEWELLAAIGYQESHWNPRAISPTGVRGVMMLTQTTARSMGVKRRTDAKQSIFGGAKYFSKLLSRIPERITGEDRYWFALAAYNVGRGHLEDGRILSQRAGQSPDHWNDVAQHLPKLTQARWYKTVKHGYARGYEPVRYVTNISNYWSILKLEGRYQAIQDTPTESEIMGPPAPKTPTELPETL
ncbi:MAG: membrane-bound lytic murein transglycosylase MltF [Motiliproteus sp.]